MAAGGTGAIPAAPVNRPGELLCPGPGHPTEKHNSVLPPRSTRRAPARGGQRGQRSADTVRAWRRGPRSSALSRHRPPCCGGRCAGRPRRLGGRRGPRYPAGPLTERAAALPGPQPGPGSAGAAHPPASRWRRSRTARRAPPPHVTARRLPPPAAGPGAVCAAVVTAAGDRSLPSRASYTRAGGRAAAGRAERKTGGLGAPT